METIKEGYDRVTDILSIFQAYAHVDKKKLKEAQDIGNQVHEAIENYYKGKFWPLDRKLQGYFDSFLQYQQRMMHVPKIVETRYYDEGLKITGKVDLVTTDNTLIDFKTGSWTHEEIWTLQANFYADFIEMNEDLAIERCYFVRLKKDGSYPEVIPIYITGKGYSACMNAYQAYQFFKSFKPVDYKSDCIIPSL